MLTIPERFWRDLLFLLLGALLAYAFSAYQRHQEIEARREVLIKALVDELAFIDREVQQYKVTEVFYRDPIRLNVPVRLLDGETLTHRKHGTLIQSLLTLEVIVAKYNDFVQTANLAQSVAAIPDSAHKQMYDTMVRLHGGVILARDEVLKLLSASDR